MVTIQQEFPGIAEEFSRVGAEVAYRSHINGSKLVVEANGATRTFKIPTRARENQGRTPGWFLAGIWDHMNLEDRKEYPDSGHLQGWGFKPQGDGTWMKSIAPSGSQWLIYDASTNGLYLRNTVSHSVTDKGQFPTKSVFHAQKLFEENGWFGSGEEAPVKSGNFADYIDA
jgi:hypothetical protein